MNSNLNWGIYDPNSIRLRAINRLLKTNIAIAFTFLSNPRRYLIALPFSSRLNHPENLSPVVSSSFSAAATRNGLNAAQHREDPRPCPHLSATSLSTCFFCSELWAINSISLLSLSLYSAPKVYHLHRYYHHISSLNIFFWSKFLFDTWEKRCGNKF